MDRRGPGLGLSNVESSRPRSYAAESHQPDLSRLTRHLEICSDSPALTRAEAYDISFAYSYGVLFLLMEIAS